MSWDKRIKEFETERKNYDQDLAEVIIKTNQVESLLENIILIELKPDRSNYTFMKDVLFNSAYLSMGAKVKLARNVYEKNQWKGLSWDRVYTLLRIRNSFAHTNPIYQESFSRHSIEDEETHLKDILVLENKNGTIGKKSWIELITKFREVYDEIYDSLKEKSEEAMRMWGQNVFSKITRINQGPSRDDQI